MLKTIVHTESGLPQIVSADAYDLISHDLPVIGTDKMIGWLAPQGACLYSTVKGLRVRVNPFDDGFEPQAA